MKVLIHDEVQAYLCPGGKQVLATQLRGALNRIGVAAEYSRWWDQAQQVDVLHALDCSPRLAWMAGQARVPIVLTHIVDEMASAPERKKLVHQLRNRGIRRWAPERVRRAFSWSALDQVAQFVYITSADAQVATALYGVPTERTTVIPHGCDPEVLEQLGQGARSAGSYLVTVGSIVPRKNSVALARAARAARVPTRFVGRPFSRDDSYYKEFLGLVDGRFVVYDPETSDDEKVDLLRGASGFVMASRAESGCIAVHEAAGACLPMLLPDRTWAHSYPRSDRIAFFDLDERSLTTAIADFFQTARRGGEPSFPVLTWDEVARAYTDVYERALTATSAPTDPPPR